MSKAASNYNHLRDELAKVRNASAPGPPVSPVTQVPALDLKQSEEFKMVMSALKSAEQSVVDLKANLEKEVSQKNLLEVKK